MKTPIESNTPAVAHASDKDSRFNGVVRVNSALPISRPVSYKISNAYTKRSGMISDLIKLPRVAHPHRERERV